MIILPSIALLAIFVYGFIGQTLKVSLTDWGREAALALHPEISYVGLKNYHELFTGFLNMRFRQDLANMFFFTEITNGKKLVGIAYLSENTSDIRIIDPINENTSILTYPVDGFVFGVSDIDDSNCNVNLYNIKKKGFAPISAISSMSERTLFGIIKKGLLHISLTDTEMNLKRISVIKKDVFDKAFSSLISEMGKASTKSLPISPYWYTEDYRLSELNNQYNDNYHDYGDEPDYLRDTWDAMTDGMYGDMPDGFDGNYDFLGR